MSNSIGKIFRVFSFGESHGEGIGALIDGCPAGLPINLEKITADLRRRRPGHGPLDSPRKEEDDFQVLSGLFNDTTTGAPIGLWIANRDCDPSGYETRRHTPRPGHADFTAFAKYGGFEDTRGGGRFSARITAGFVMAGGVAKQLLETVDVSVSARVLEIGGMADSDRFAERIIQAKEEGDSVGGVIEGVAKHLPAGLGEPVFDNLDGELAKALFAIPAVKGVEFGDGFSAARKRGSENNDPFEARDGKITTRTNHAGGILGGLSNGMPLVVRAAFKPVASIAKSQKTVDLKTGKPAELKIAGRFDPCPVPRAVVIVEATLAIVLADFCLRGGFIPRVLKVTR